MKKRKISITSENGVKMSIESECTPEQLKKIKVNCAFIHPTYLNKVLTFERDFDVNVSINEETITIEKTLGVATPETFTAMETIANEFFNMVDSWPLEKPENTDEFFKMVDSRQPEKLENTKETSQDKRQEYVEFCKAILCDWDNIPRTCGAIIECAFESKTVKMPAGWIGGDLLQKLLQCYVEHNS